MVIDKSLPILLLDYLIFEGRLVYNKKWDKIAKLQLDLKLKSNEF